MPPARPARLCDLVRPLANPAPDPGDEDRNGRKREPGDRASIAMLSDEEPGGGEPEERHTEETKGSLPSGLGEAQVVLNPLAS